MSFTNLDPFVPADLAERRWVYTAILLMALEEAGWKPEEGIKATPQQIRRAAASMRVYWGERLPALTASYPHDAEWRHPEDPY